MPAPGETRLVPEETPVAFAYEGASYAVMMATPADLADFALGFSLNEGVIRAPDDIEALDIVPGDDGILLRMALVRRAGVIVLGAAALSRRPQRLRLVRARKPRRSSPPAAACEGRHPGRGR